jgi:hypothetical protein
VYQNQKNLSLNEISWWFLFKSYDIIVYIYSDGMYQRVIHEDGRLKKFCISKWINWDVGYVQVEKIPHGLIEYMSNVKIGELEEYDGWKN